ncbi:MAG TPA: cytochrome P450 [Candidatus Dormibacteraeota bacterium]|nr:cytochrome P450 [Candidatus Dormibacteraeota bacterium]
MQLSDVDLANPDNYQHAGPPYEMFALLRREAPVFWHPDKETPGFWALTRHADVANVSKNSQLFSAARRGVFLFESNEEDLSNLQMMLVNRDPPQHTQLRRMVSPGFTPRRIAMLEETVRLRAGEIIDRVAARGECDFVTDLAADLPLQVIAELVGVPMEDRGKVFEWSNQLIGFDDPEYSGDREEQKRCAMEVYLYANQLAEKRREQPTDDLTSILINGEVDGERLTEMEFDLFFLLLLVAGNETTRNAISGGMLALINNPGQRARLIANPALTNIAAEEIVRWVTPVNCFRRTAMQDTTIGGQRVREGDKVVMFYPSANRDERVFPNPDSFDVGRTPNEHLAFGVGTHFCLGNALARLEIKVMFEELLRRLPDIELAGPVECLRSSFINGIKRMPVRFTPERLRRSA